MAFEDIGKKLEYENIAHMKTQLRNRVLKLEKRLEALGKDSYTYKRSTPRCFLQILNQ